jgi:hypothetical protein
MALTQLGRLDEARDADQLAVESIEKYLELNPDEARAYSLGANSAMRLGDLYPPYLAWRDARFKAPGLLTELRKVNAGIFCGFSS